MQEMQEMRIPSLGHEDPPKQGMETHSDILACRIPLAEEPGGQQSIGSQKVGHDWSDLAQQSTAQHSTAQHSTAQCATKTIVSNDAASPILIRTKILIKPG